MASARYNLSSAKSKWEEQAFFFDDALPNYGLEQFVHNRLNALGWFQFGRQPTRANFNWGVEFYANNAEGDNFSVVRGKRVPATATIINEIFDLPNDAPSFYQLLQGFEEEDYETMKDLLCLPNIQWNTTGRNPYSVSRQSLQPEAKLWNTFVKRNLLPTSHNQTVDRTRLLLINTIMTGYRVNVGEILSNELAAHCRSDKGILAFPSLVTALCHRVHTPIFDTDKFQAEKTGWTRAVYMRKMNIADAQPINMAMPTPPASPQERKEYVIEEAVPNDPGPNAPRADKEKFKKHMDDMLDVGCSPVGAHVIKMMGYIQTLEKLGFALNDELAIDVVLQSLPDSFSQFILNFNMNEIEKTLPQLLGMLRTAEGNMKKGGSKSVLMVREAKGKKVAKSKGNGKTKPKGKEALKPKGGVSKDGKCFHCGKTGHWKRNCPIYLEDVKKAKAVGASVSDFVL
ncbi:hypothetical protein GQ457_02G033680 [Hibiscus cannabinus]